jgi:hypothetical protein
VRITYRAASSRRTAGARLAGAAAVAVLLLSSCATTVSGTPTAGDGGGTGATTEATQSTESTETTEPTETTEAEPGTEDLDCAGDDIIAPEGQPFCVEVPAGFRSGAVDIENTAGSAASFSTGILLSERDLIILSVYELDVDSDDLTDQELTDALAEIIDQLAAQGFDFTDTEPQILEVDGARAFYYTGADATGLRSDTYFIFRGQTELQINCQRETMEAEVLAGCEQVLETLQITG